MSETIKIRYVEETCWDCGGDGIVTLDDVCPDCDGDDDECESCDGDGRVFEAEEGCLNCDGDGYEERPPLADAVIEELEPVMQLIANHGIGVTVPDGSGKQCCGGCIAAAAEPGERGGWIGFHDQALDGAARGQCLYIHHDLPNDDDRKYVIDTLSEHFDFVWGGDDAQCFQITPK